MVVGSTLDYYIFFSKVIPGTKFSQKIFQKFFMPQKEPLHKNLELFYSVSRGTWYRSKRRKSGTFRIKSRS
jgi:hypothetical protein